jgi:hypothetical protein
MAKKVSLTDLLPPKSEESDETEANSVVTEGPAPEAEKVVALKAPSTAGRTPRVRTSEPEKPTAGEPKYLQMDRKDARLRPGQYEDLMLLSHQLNKKRRRTGERITENTLIRIGIDLLFQRASELEGIDEEQLRKSVGL